MCPLRGESLDVTYFLPPPPPPPPGHLESYQVPTSPPLSSSSPPARDLAASSSVYTAIRSISASPCDGRRPLSLLILLAARKPNSPTWPTAGVRCILDRAGRGPIESRPAYSLPAVPPPPIIMLHIVAVAAAAIASRRFPSRWPLAWIGAASQLIGENEPPALRLWLAWPSAKQTSCANGRLETIPVPATAAAV